MFRLQHLPRIPRCSSSGVLSLRLVNVSSVYSTYWTFLYLPPMRSLRVSKKVSDTLWIFRDKLKFKDIPFDFKMSLSEDLKTTLLPVINKFLPCILIYLCWPIIPDDFLSSNEILSHYSKRSGFMHIWETLLYLKNGLHAG